jgi:hypothetical protein
VRPILAGAVGLARRALLELQPTGVGEHLGVTAEGECAATHHFAATLPGYRGWQWAVVVAAPPEADRATVSESALLPGPDALVAPEFVPWDQRVRPGDLAPGDLLAPPPNDARLAPGYLLTGDPVADEVAEEIGLGRPQVLSCEGRAEAADRWYSEYGPDTDMARGAPATCGVCGFFVPLAGALRSAFGVCANAMGADGHVVHTTYGCGAHSDTVLPTGGGSPRYQAYDDAAVDLIQAADLTASEPGEPRARGAQAPSAPADSSATQPDAAPTAPEAADPPAPADSPVTDSVAPVGDSAIERCVEAVAPATGRTSADVPAGAGADAPAGYPAGGAGSVAEGGDPARVGRYDQAWAVAAVRVQPGESGVAGSN